MGSWNRDFSDDPHSLTEDLKVQCSFKSFTMRIHFLTHWLYQNDVEQIFSVLLSRVGKIKTSFLYIDFEFFADYLFICYVELI